MLNINGLAKLFHVNILFSLPGIQLRISDSFTAIQTYVALFKLVFEGEEKYTRKIKPRSILFEYPRARLQN